MFTPLVLIVLSTLAIVMHLCFTCKLTRTTLFPLLVPVVLRIGFLSYPIVTNVAFEAFSCFYFRYFFS